MAQVPGTRCKLLVLCAALVCTPAALAAPSYGDETPPPEVQTALALLEPQRPGVIDMYAVIIAGDGDEDVFRKEAHAVRRVLDDRLGTSGRSLMLINRRSLPRQTRSLRTAGSLAIELVHNDERAARVEHSYPQLRSGFAIEDKLRTMERRLASP